MCQSLDTFSWSTLVAYLDAQYGAEACKALVQIELVCIRGQVLDVQGRALLLCARRGMILRKRCLRMGLQRLQCNQLYLPRIS